MTLLILMMCSQLASVICLTYSFTNVVDEIIFTSIFITTDFLVVVILASIMHVVNKSEL